MTWRQSRRLKLFLFLWLPAACFDQDVGGSRADSNPLNAYAPPCISQVKQNIAVSCQITPTGGTQPYSYAFTGSFPAGMSMSTGLGGGLINGTPTGITGEQATVTVTDARGGEHSNCFHDYASRIDGHRSLRERHLRHGLRLCDQNGCRLYDPIV